MPGQESEVGGKARSVCVRVCQPVPRCCSAGVRLQDLRWCLPLCHGGPGDSVALGFLCFVFVVGAVVLVIPVYLPPMS